MYHGWIDPVFLVGIVARELAMFAAIGFLLGGLDDLVIDLIWIARTIWRRLTIYMHYPRADAATLAPPRQPGRLAIFVAAWQEDAVIGGMVANALARLHHPAWRLYVGCYPNDPATIAAIERAANGDPHVRIVVGSGRSLAVGGGVWGAAQPGAARLDAGPSVVLRAPVAGHVMAIALNWRKRIVGSAKPGSGITLTVATDF